MELALLLEALSVAGVVVVAVAVVPTVAGVFVFCWRTLFFFLSTIVLFLWEEEKKNL